MTKRRIVWLPDADRTVTGIFEYLKVVAGSRVARKVVERIYAKPLILELHPFAGPREELLEERKEEFRYLVEGNYKIIYYVEQHEIVIYLVFDCRQDPEALKYKKSER